jgi:8-oxo-dGTP pyrophosphatase MutT (NUDIX family)
MVRIRSDHVEVHLFRRRGRSVEFLILRRSPDRRKLPGVWQPVTGARTARERALAAAMREVNEETGLAPLRWWGVEGLTGWFDARDDAWVMLPVFAAELPARAAITLSKEHDRHAWVSARTAARRFLWESQRRALAAVCAQVLGPAALADANRISVPGRSGAGTRATRRRT